VTGRRNAVLRENLFFMPFDIINPIVIERRITIYNNIVENLGGGGGGRTDATLDTLYIHVYIRPYKYTYIIYI